MSVEQSFFHQIHRYSFPANCTNFKNVFHTLTTEEGSGRRFYIGPDPDRVRLSQEDSMSTVLLAGDIMVAPEAVEHAGIDEAYLNTSISGMDVYVPLFGCGYYLYTGHELKYKVLPHGEKPAPEETLYVKVEYTNEQTVADLIRHCWWYSYNRHSGTYLLLTEEGKISNLLRYRLQVAALRLCGTAEDRLADYGRVLAFLLSKVVLTEQEKNLLAPFLRCVPDLSTLAAIADKDGVIRSLVNFAHASPLDFMISQDWDPREIQNAD